MNQLPIAMLAPLFLGATAHGQTNINQPPIAETLKDWKAVRIALYADGGDYIPNTTYYLLQKMNAGQVILSSSSLSQISLPEFRAILPADAAQKAIDRAVAFYAPAQKEISEGERIRALPELERTREFKKYTFGISGISISIEVCSKGKTFNYMNEFEEKGPALHEFIKFLDELKEGLK